MIRCFAWLLFAFCSFTSLAQTYSVVESDETQVSLHTTKNMVCKRKRVVTVLHEKGKETANFHSSYNEKMSALRKFKGIVMDSNGRVIREIKKSDLMRTEYSKELASDVFHYIYEYFPSQYPYTISYEWEENYMDAILGFPVFLPQQSYNQEVKHSSYNLLVPGDMDCRFKQMNCNVEITQESVEKGKKRFSFQLSDLPALVKEPYAPEVKSLFPHVYSVPCVFNFEKTSGKMENWQTYGLWLYSLLEGRGDLPKELVEKIKGMTANCINDYERVKVVYDYLEATTRYVSIQLGIGGLQPALAASVYKTGFGDCKALVNYAASLLKVIGVSSVHAVISTDNERLMTDFASANQTNHVILQVPLANDTLWLECTAPALPLGYVHSSIAGHDALLLKPEGGELYRLPIFADSLNVQANHIQIVLDTSGEASISVCQNNRLFRYEDMLGFKSSSVKNQTDFLRGSINLNQTEINDIVCKEQKSAHPSLDLSYKVYTHKYGNQTGKRMFIPLNVFHARFSVPEVCADRVQDVFIPHGFVDKDSIEIKLPEGYGIEAFPSVEDLTTPFGEFHTNFELHEGTLLVVQRLYVRSGRYPKEMYHDFREFRKTVSELYNTKLILRKLE